MSDDLYNQIIRPNYTKLSEDARPDHIVDLLFQYGGIDFHDMEQITRIRENKGYREGMKALLTILQQKGPDVVRMFVSVLGEAGYSGLESQLKISENSPLPEPTPVVLENHSNRILQLEQEVATLRADKQAEAENKAEIENLKYENSEMKIQLSALKAELNVKKETKNQNEYRSQNQETRGHMSVIQPNLNERELTPEDVQAVLAEWKAYMKWLKEIFRKLEEEIEEANEEGRQNMEALRERLNRYYR